MNVLIFVMTMLMLLAAMTYARLETYRNSQVFQILFENYMEKDERGYINLSAEKRYDSTVGKAREGGGSQTKADGSPRISLFILFKHIEKEQAPQEAASFLTLLKNLMITLYSDQPFYQEMLQTRPSFIDEIPFALVQAVSRLPDNQKLKKAADIANVSLGDDQLDEVFYKMLQGAPYKEIYAKALSCLSVIPSEEVESDEDKDDTAIIVNEAEEHQSKKGYYSLLDFITLQPTQKVRVYLASKEVLKAIYLDDATVNDIISKRKELFHQTKLADAEGIKSLSESFKNEFDHRQDANIGDVLDFTVSKTNPKKYE